MKTLIIIFIVFIILVAGSMVFFAYLADKYNSSLSRKRLNIVDGSSPYRRDKKINIKPHNDFLSKNRIKEQLREEKLVNQVYALPKAASQKSSDVIVGVVNPIGRWTHFIVKQKLGFILALRGLQGNNKGSWVNRIKAQDISKSSEKGKGR